MAGDEPACGSDRGAVIGSGAGEMSFARLAAGTWIDRTTNLLMASH